MGHVSIVPYSSLVRNFLGCDLSIEFVIYIICLFHIAEWVQRKADLVS